MAKFFKTGRTLERSPKKQKLNQTEQKIVKKSKFWTFLGKKSSKKAKNESVRAKNRPKKQKLSHFWRCTLQTRVASPQREVHTPLRVLQKCKKRGHSWDPQPEVHPVWKIFQKTNTSMDEFHSNVRNCRKRPCLKIGSTLSFGGIIKGPHNMDFLEKVSCHDKKVYFWGEAFHG